MGFAMEAFEGGKPILLIKKLGGLLLLLFGLLLLVMGFNGESTGLTALGVFSLAGGALLLALKIRRRNQGNQL
jgi:hypothetical protein